jgi:hypothetical protein
MYPLAFIFGNKGKAQQSCYFLSFGCQQSIHIKWSPASCQAGNVPCLQQFGWFGHAKPLYDSHQHAKCPLWLC